MIMSRDQHAKKYQKMKTSNKSVERMEKFKCLGTALRNQNRIHEEINCRLKLWNIYYHFVQVYIKNIRYKIHRIIILPAFLYGLGIWSLTSMEERRLMMFENRVLRRIFGPKREKVTGYGEDYIMRKSMTYIPHQILLTYQINKIERAVHVARVGSRRRAFRFLC